MSFTIKALLFLWPFLKRALFGDATVKDILLDNKHITLVYTCFLLLIVAMFHLTGEFGVVNSELYNMKKSVIVVPVVAPPPSDKTLVDRRKLLGELLK